MDWWSRWHARSAEKSAAPPSVPRRVRPICRKYCTKYLLGVTLGGGPHKPPTQSSQALGEPCWHYFSLLGASWAHFASLAAFVAPLGRFLCVLERSGLDFGAFLVRFWWILATQDNDFRSFFAQGCCHCRHALDATKPQFHWVGTHFARNALDAKNDEKSLPEPCACSVVPKSVACDARGYYCSALGTHL